MLEIDDEEKANRRLLANYLRSIRAARLDVNKAFFLGQASLFASFRFSTQQKTFLQWLRIRDTYFERIFR